MVECTPNIDILLFESDDDLAKALDAQITVRTHLVTHRVETIQNATSFLEKQVCPCFAAVVSLDHPDSNSLLELLTQQGVSIVGYSGEMNDERRSHLATWGVAYMVSADQGSRTEAVAASVARLVTNRDVTILVVDDSRSMRAALTRFLSVRRYRVLTAENGQEALNALEDHPEIQLVITDNEMPEMDGYSLIKTIRPDHPKDDLAIIGISAKTNSMLSVKFINSGANDFLHKPFVKDELYCRVEHQVEMLERIRLIRELSYHDSLTKLFNRRYFFENCENFVRDARSQRKSVVVAMIDIDHFKKVNDMHGHDIGDDVLCNVSSRIAEAFDSDSIVARFGGEEFCVLTSFAEGFDLFARFDMLRRQIESYPTQTPGGHTFVTISVGVSTVFAPISDMIKSADGLLYSAKETGRNRVKIV